MLLDAVNSITFILFCNTFSSTMRVYLVVQVIQSYIHDILYHISMGLVVKESSKLKKPCSFVSSSRGHFGFKAAPIELTL